MHESKREGARPAAAIAALVILGLSAPLIGALDKTLGCEAARQ